MRVSILNLNLVGHDAIGNCIINQLRFFAERGDDARVFVEHPPQGISPDIAPSVKVVGLNDLLSGREDHFDYSDLYIYHYPGYYALMESIRTVNHGSVIFHYHNVTPPELWGSEYLRQTLEDGIAQTKLVHYADWAITVSPFNQDELVKRFGYDESRTFILPCAVNPIDFHPSSSATDFLDRYRLRGRRVLLFVGRMAGNKRIDILVEALPLIKAKVPQAILILVGDNAGNPALREISQKAYQRAVQLGVAKDVIFTGKVENDPPFSVADVYVSASLHEGFGVPLIEAMASGVPVVASRAAAHPWVIGDAGLLCEPNDPVDLANKVVQVLTDQALSSNLRERGITRAREFALDKHLQTLAQIINKAEHELTAYGPSLKRSRALNSNAVEIAASLSKIRDLYAQADIMLRDYKVHSRWPFMSRIRRALTSHIWGPYLDPTLERQVSFNREVLALLEETIRRQERQNQPPDANNPKD